MFGGASVKRFDIMSITIHRVENSRNGISGRPFTRVLFSTSDTIGILIAVIDDETKATYVVNPLAFQEDYRGDDIGKKLELTLEHM